MTSTLQQFISLRNHVCTRGRSPSSEPPEARNNKLFSESLQSSGLVDGGLLEQGGCQKSQLAGSALRNPETRTAAAYQLLRLSTVMTGGPPPRELNDRNSVVGKKKNITLHQNFFFHSFQTSLTCYCSCVEFLSKNSAHFVLFWPFCVSSPNMSNIYSLLYQPNCPYISCKQGLH